MLAGPVNVALAAVAVGLLILVHEAGHFLAAKAVGVRVEVFSIGFLSKLVAFRRGETEYRLSLIPLGGYVKLAGMTPAEASGAPDEFASKSPGRRAFVLAAGVLMNALLGLVGFIVAFTVGVPFLVAEVGYLEPGWPAWQAGMRRGDVIERINSVRNPDFQDVQREVALQGRDTASLTVRRGKETLEFELPLRYDPRQGIKRIGFAPPMLPVVTGLFKVGEPHPRCPAREAGIRIGDRIVAVDGRPVRYALDISAALRGRAGRTVQVEVERGGRRLRLDVRTEPVPEYWIGISCVSSTVKALQRGGAAERLGLREGDRILSVNAVPVRSIVEVEDELRRAPGTVELRVERGGAERLLRGELADQDAVDELLASLECRSGTTLTWVSQQGPAWEAGMRPGDKILEVAGKRVESWEDVRTAAGSERAPRLMRWVRDGQRFSATVVPARKTERLTASLGCIFDRGKCRVRKLGVLAAVKTGFYKTYGAATDILLTLRGFVRRDVSTRNLGGVVLIAYSSYRAAREGPGKLLYLTAMLSIALAFLNILPIPVLDGGHLMFLAIEKARGRPVSERVMGISQMVGLAFLIMLLAYALRNDLLRLLQMR